MLEEIVLRATPRSVTGKQVKVLRREGQLPAVIYGHGIQSQSISLNFRETSRILPGVSSSRLVVVDVDGERHTTLVREKQRHPITGALLHLDFQEVSMTEKLHVTVGLRLKGESSAVKNYSGVVVFALEKLEVQCLPQDMPDHIDVDISTLTEIGNSIYVRDLVVPAAVEVLTDLGETVVVVTPPQAEEVVEAPVVAEAAAVAEPEVIERGKKEEEEF